MFPRWNGVGVGFFLNCPTLKRQGIFAVLGFLLLLVAVVPSVRAQGTALAMPKDVGPCASPESGMFILNEDNSHFFGTRTPDEMTLEGLQAFVDQYAGTKITHLFLSPNSMRTSFRSEVWDPIWKEGGIDPPAGFGKTWVENSRLLAGRGLDPYAVWIARAREKGISPWISMRMNDLHDVDNMKSFMHSGSGEITRNYGECRTTKPAAG